MKKKIKNTIPFILSAILIISLTGCGKEETPVKVEEYGDIEDATEISEQNTEEEEEEVSLPYYDIANVSQPTSYEDDEKFETKTSYYKEQLGTRPKKAFDAIYNAAENMSNNIELESAQFVTPSELKYIMNIMFCDCPELFYLNDSYTYTVNTEGYVTNVSIEFSMSAEEIQSTQYNLSLAKPDYLELRKDNDYDTIKRLINEIDYDKYYSVIVNDDGSCDKSCESIFNYYQNSIGISKLVCYWLRQLGIDCTVVLGEPVSSTLTDEYELVADYLKFCEETPISDNTYNVKFNYSTYWMWNVVKIDDNWYNLDVAYSFLLKEHEDLLEEDTLYFVPDRTMAQTRLYYINEEILGISPSCTDNNYETSYRNGYYVLPHTETQIVLRIKQEIAKIDQENIFSIKYQFQDEDTFNYFLENIDEQFEYYNKTYGEPIGIYSITSDRDSLTIIIHDIVNNF